MTQEYQANQDQAMRWNGHAGMAWVELQTLLDQLFAPLAELLADAAQSSGASAILDVGCGTGATTLAIARRLGSAARCTGADISQPMIAMAKERAAQLEQPVTFMLADVQTYGFGSAGFDLIVSRLGVMFFDDPVGAFSNLRQAAMDGAGLKFIAWRGPEENPFMTAAECAAMPLLPALRPRQPDEPGQFGFADPSRIARVLEESGWSEIDIQPLNISCVMPEKELIHYASMLGPVGLMLQRESEQKRAEVLAAMRAAFAPFVHGDEVRFTSACWLVGARSFSS